MRTSQPHRSLRRPPPRRATIVRAFGALAALCTIGTVGCASAGTPAADAPTIGVARFASKSDARPNSATITSADLARMPDAANAYDAVRFLRPLFLRPRPGGSALRGRAPVLAVYIDDAYAGGVDVLQMLPTNVVEQMRYLQRSEALTFAGTSTPGDGFIMVTLKHGGR